MFLKVHNIFDLPICYNFYIFFNHITYKLCYTLSICVISDYFYLSCRLVC